MKPPLDMVQRAIATFEKDKKCAEIACEYDCEDCDLAHDINESIDAADMALAELKRLEREIKKDQVCLAALEEFGFENQMLKSIEELAELQRAIARAIVAPSDRDNIHEEIADVEIMLNQMRLIFDPTEIDDWKDSKLERLARMVGVDIENEEVEE